VTVDTMYSLIKFICAKNQQGYIAPADFNTVINQAQLSYLNFLFGQVEQYQIGMPISKVSISLTQTTREILTAFIDPPTTLTIDASGLAPYPDDFQRADAMYTTSMNRIKFVQQDFLWSTLQSRINPVATNPIYIMESDGFRFYPNTNYNSITLGTALLSYVKTPEAIVWGFNLDANGRPIYSPGTSVDPVWYDLDCMQIIARALHMIGINLQVGAVTQYADEIIKLGE
jgi:hypothetical protein